MLDGHGTVTQRCEVMAEDLTQQLRRDITDCECFSLQLDKFTDTSDTAQLCILIWMVFTDMTAKEELSKLLPMKERAYVCGQFVAASLSCSSKGSVSNA